MEEKELSRESVFYNLTDDISTIENPEIEEEGNQINSILIYGGDRKTRKNAVYVMAKAFDEDSIVLKIPTNETGNVENVLENQGEYFKQLQKIIESHKESGYKIVLYFEDISNRIYNRQNFMTNFYNNIVVPYVWNVLYHLDILFIATAEDISENNPVYVMFINKKPRGRGRDNDDDVTQNNKRIHNLNQPELNIFKQLPIRRPQEPEGEDFNPFDF